MEIQCEQLWAEPWQGCIYKAEQIGEFIESDCSLSSTNKTKCKSAHVAAACIVLSALMAHDLNSSISSTCHSAGNIAKDLHIILLLLVSIVSQGNSHINVARLIPFLNECASILHWFLHCHRTLVLGGLSPSLKAFSFLKVLFSHWNGSF